MSALLLAAALLLPLNPQVTPDTIHSTICVPGWTATVRPPVAYTNKIKRHLMDQAGIPWERSHDIELDHRIALAIGGAPRDPANLWLQTWAATAPEGWPVDADAHGKDRLEVHLRDLVCAGALPLADAQQCIWNDWRACAERFPSHAGQLPEKGLP